MSRPDADRAAMSFFYLPDHGSSRQFRSSGALFRRRPFTARSRHSCDLLKIAGNFVVSHDVQKGHETREVRRGGLLADALGE